VKRQNCKVLVNGEPQIWTGVNFWSRTSGPLMWRNYDPRVVVGELEHEDGRRFVWLINLVDAALSCEPRLRAGALRQLEGARELTGKSVELGPFGVRVLELEASSGRAARAR